jgi:hypothetical protein
MLFHSLADSVFQQSMTLSRPCCSRASLPIRVHLGISKIEDIELRAFYSFDLSSGLQSCFCLTYSLLCWQHALLLLQSKTFLWPLSSVSFPHLPFICSQAQSNAMP